jgi:hypothetical protein
MRLLFVGVAAIALSVGTQSRPPDASPAGTSESRSTIGKLDAGKKTNKTQDQGQCKTDVPPVAQALNCNVIEQPQPKTEAEIAKANSLDTLTRRYMRATIVGVVGAGFGLIILFLQTLYLRRSVNLAKVSADAAKDAADASAMSAQAALNNLNLVIASERALIEIDLVAPTTYIDEETGEECLGTRVGDYARYGISAKNHGKTAARMTQCRISSDCSKPEEFSFNRFKPRLENTNEQLLGSGIQTVLENFNLTSLFTDADWDLCKVETHNAIIRIDLVYWDILKNGPEGRHETSAVFKWDMRKDEPSRLFKYNVYT